MKELIIGFEANKEWEEYEGLPINFIYTDAIVYEGDKMIGSANLLIDGNINDGTQEGVLAGEYTIDTFDFDNIIYHNNEDGKDYSVEEFVKEFCGNDKYKMINEYATRYNIHPTSVGTL